MFLSSIGLSPQSISLSCSTSPKFHRLPSQGQIIPVARSSSSVSILPSGPHHNAFPVTLHLFPLSIRPISQHTASLPSPPLCLHRSPLPHLLRPSLASVSPPAVSLCLRAQPAVGTTAAILVPLRPCRRHSRVEHPHGYPFCLFADCPTPTLVDATAAPDLPCSPLFYFVLKLSEVAL